MMDNTMDMTEQSREDYLKTHLVDALDELAPNVKVLKYKSTTRMAVSDLKINNISITWQDSRGKPLELSVSYMPSNLMPEPQAFSGAVYQLLNATLNQIRTEPVDPIYSDEWIYSFLKQTHYLLFAYPKPQSAIMSDKTLLVRHDVVNALRVYSNPLDRLSPFYSDYNRSCTLYGLPISPVDIQAIYPLWLRYTIVGIPAWNTLQIAVAMNRKFEIETFSRVVADAPRPADTESDYAK